ncbi:MAG: hypothetical protein II943_12190 [Victivallales bacterium]|nr:hypothetical protein [Victivallales bacterium]
MPSLRETLESLGISVVFVNVRSVIRSKQQQKPISDAILREFARGVWRIQGLNATDETCPDYLIAIDSTDDYKICGIYHIVKMYNIKSVAPAYPDFPTEPKAEREVDRWEGRFKTLTVAKQNLNPSEFQRLKGRLTAAVERRGMPVNPDTLKTALDNFKKRFYFSVDDNVPAKLTQFVNQTVPRDDFRLKGFTAKLWPTSRRK